MESADSRGLYMQVCEWGAVGMRYDQFDHTCLAS